MLNYYHVHYTTKLNGEVISTDHSSCICTEEEIKNEVIAVNWQNLGSFYNEYGLVCGFNVWNVKKGRRISPFDKMLHDRKEWEHPETGLTFEVVYRMCEPSIQTILEWHEQSKAIQYLNERNL